MDGLEADERFYRDRPGASSDAAASATQDDVDDACLDLRTWRCPLSWAKARVWLETRRRGEEVVILLGDAKSAHDLPRAAEAHGHHVIGVVRDGGGFRVVIEV